MAILIDTPEAANRKARAIASDLAAYNEAKIKEGVENDTLWTVLAEEIVSLLDPRPGDTVVDGTFGAGGHASLLAARLRGDGKLIAIDRDPTVAPFFERFRRETGVKARLHPGEFSTVSDHKDNVHWFTAESETAFIFNIHVLNVKPGSEVATGRIYVDPNGEKLKDGLIRARLLEYDEVNKLYG